MKCFKNNSPFAFVNDLSKLSLKMLENDEHEQLKILIDNMFNKIDTKYTDDMHETLDVIKTDALNYIAPVNGFNYLTDEGFQFPECLIMINTYFGKYLMINKNSVLNNLHTETDISVAHWIINNIKPIHQDEYSWILNQTNRKFAAIIKPYVNFALTRGSDNWYWGQNTYDRLIKMAAAYGLLDVINLVHNLRNHICELPYNTALINENIDVFQWLYEYECDMRSNLEMIDGVCCDECKKFYTHNLNYDRYVDWIKIAKATKNTQLIKLIKSSTALIKYENDSLQPKPKLKRRKEGVNINLLFKAHN